MTKVAEWTCHGLRAGRHTEFSEESLMCGVGLLDTTSCDNVILSEHRRSETPLTSLRVTSKRHSEAKNLGLAHS